MKKRGRPSIKKLIESELEYQNQKKQTKKRNQKLENIEEMLAAEVQEKEKEVGGKDEDGTKEVERTSPNAIS